MDERDYKALNDSLKDKNKHKPAFPSTDGKTFASDGLTKREYFAGLAMQGLMSNSTIIVNDIENIKQCVLIADELLKQLSYGK